MYKLVVVAGKLRGKEFPLEEGSVVIGRGSEADIQVDAQGVSKKHFRVTTTESSCYIEDLGSSNGTFLNEKLIQGASVKSGDKITLPNVIFQVVFVKEKAVYVENQTAQEEPEEEDFKTGGVAPKPLPSKLIWLFKYRFMNFLHGMNEEYEWRHLLAILLSLFCIAAISLTIFPVLDQSKTILLKEVAKRASSYARRIADTNKKALQQRQIEKLDTLFLKDEDGVQDFRLMDMEGRIVSPFDLRNEYVQDPFYVQSLNWGRSSARQNGDTLKKLLDQDKIGVAKIIYAFNPKKATEEAVGIVAIRFEPSSLREESSKSQKAYLEALVTTALVGIFFYGIIYFLTIRPLEEVHFQVEEALRGRRKSLESSYLFQEMNSLINTINSMLQRIRELNNEEDDEFAEIESDENYVRTLYEFMQGAGVAVIVLDSEKNLSHINNLAEDLCGIRESASQGLNLLDVTREKGFAATIIELADNSANNLGSFQQGEYDIGGAPHYVNVTSLLGKDGFAKAFYVTLVRVD